MSDRGYAGTPVSAICAQAGVAATSLYWHFGSKEGLLATVMERGAQRWFAALPRWDEHAPIEGVVRDGADAVARHPVFLRLFYQLALEGGDDEVAAELVQRVRRHAFDYFRTGIAAMTAADHSAEVAAPAVEELTRFAVAYSDGCFFAGQLEPDQTDLRRMYGDLIVAVRAMAPTVIARTRRTAPQAARRPR